VTPNQYQSGLQSAAVILHRLGGGRRRTVPVKNARGNGVAAASQDRTAWHCLRLFPLIVRASLLW